MRSGILIGNEARAEHLALSRLGSGLKILTQSSGFQRVTVEARAFRPAKSCSNKRGFSPGPSPFTFRAPETPRFRRTHL